MIDAIGYVATVIEALWIVSVLVGFAGLVLLLILGVVSGVISLGKHLLPKLMPPPKPAQAQPTQSRTRPKRQPDCLRFRRCSTGIIAYHESNAAAPLAWILPGFHLDMTSNPPKRCTFVDVAYYRKTTNGINLETFECDSRKQAKAILASIFDGNPTPTPQTDKDG